MVKMITAGQCRAARAFLDISQGKLAQLAGLGLQTIVDFERERRAVANATVLRIRSALEGLGIQFTNGAGGGVRLIPPPEPL